MPSLFSLDKRNLFFSLLLALIFSTNSFAQNNTCNIKAIFTPCRDTIVVDSFLVTYANLSQKGLSATWLLDGSVYTYAHPQIDTLQVRYFGTYSVGIHKVELAVTDGICFDTARCYIVVTGVLPDKEEIKTDGLLFGLNNSRIETDLVTNTAASIDTVQGSNYQISGSYKIYGKGSIKSQHGILASITENGCINWAKAISDESSYFLKSFTAKNGDILACYSKNGSSYSNLLMRVDNAGNLLWSKTLIKNATLAVIKEDADQNICILGTIFSSFPDYKKGYIILKVDKNGNTIWAKTFLNSLTSILDFYPIIVNDIIQVENDYYICGYANNQYSYNASGLISKISAKDGTHQWTKLYNVDSIKNNHAQDLHYVNGKLLLNYSLSTLDYNLKNNDRNPYQLFAYADTSGNIQKAYQIKIDTFPMGGSISSSIQMLPNNDFYIKLTSSEKTGLQPPTIYHYIFIKVSNIDTLKFARIFSASEGSIASSTISYNGGIYTLGSIMSPLFTYTYPNNNLLISKFDSIGNTTQNCDIYNISPTIRPCSFSNTDFHWEIDSVISVKLDSVFTSLSDISLFKKWRCPYAIDTCSLLKLDGPQNVCDLSSVFKYKVHKLPGCGYSLNTSKDVNILSQTDSVISVSFKKNGLHKIKVTISNSCNPLTDSLIVYVSPTNATFSIGNDTVICPGTKIILNAGNKFVSYKWQDGSNKSTLTVSDTGKYYVTVVDSCNNIVSDSIYIKLASTIYIDTIKDQKICFKDSLTLQAATIYNSYSWIPANNFIQVSPTQIKVFPQATTTYIMKALNAQGCTIFDTALIEVLKPPSINLGNDTTICSGNSLLLNAGVGFISYMWNDGSTEPLLNISGSGTYWVKAKDVYGCSSFDSIKVFVQNIPSFSLGNDTALCGQQTLLLRPTISGACKWQDGTILQNQLIKSPGLYWLEVNKNGCYYRDSIVVTYNPFPIIQLTSDTIICNQNTIILNATQPSNTATYKWQDGSGAGKILVTRPGTYIVKVVDKGCELTDTCTINYEYSPTLNLGNDTIKCEGDIIHFDLSFPNSTFLWQDLSMNPIYDIGKAGNYYCTVSNFCGTVSDTIVVKDQKCECQLLLPNIFSPNGDGINDEFKTSISCTPSFFKLVIFDRDGHIVFETSDYLNYWKGTFKGKPVPVGTYYYIIKVKGSFDPIMKQKSGGITIIR